MIAKCMSISHCEVMYLSERVILRQVRVDLLQNGDSGKCFFFS